MTVRRGLDLTLSGEPRQVVDGAPSVRSVALYGDDYPGIRARLSVQTGDRVQLGDPLFSHRHDERVRVVSPISGEITGIELGARRALKLLTIRAGGGDGSAPRTDRTYRAPGDIREALLASGLWPALRARPFERVPGPDDDCEWLFVTAMDTRPHAPDPAALIADRPDDFRVGVDALNTLAKRRVFVCAAPSADLGTTEFAESVQRVDFAGPHPAGLPGTHIRHLVRCTAERQAWHVGYQDVMCIGRLLGRGALDFDRVVALAGDGCRNPRLVTAPLGASVADIARKDLKTNARVRAGSPLAAFESHPGGDYLRRGDRQVTCLHRGRTVSALQGWWRRALAARRHAHLLDGASGPILSRHRRGFVPLAAYDRVWPWADAAAPVLRSLLAGDIEAAVRLGCLSLAPQDLALCTLVCPDRRDYGGALNALLEHYRHDD